MVIEIKALGARNSSVSGSAQVMVPVEVSVSPGKATLKPSATRQFSVTKVLGTSNQGVTWSVMQPDGGSIDTNGLYTAPAVVGTYVVLATSQADPRFFASAEVRVTESGAIDLSITPDYVELKKNGTTAFTATVLGSDNTAVTWSCDAGSIDASGNYTAPATFGTFTVKATSVADPEVVATATVVVSPLQGDDRTYTYDENGNLLSDGARTFEWDEENRLVSVTKGTHRSEFVYDGLGRRVQILEKDIAPDQSTTTSSYRKFLWAGTEIAEERRGDDGGTVQKRFFAQGFVDSDGTILLYTRDHLGSIRELVDMSQVVRARYEYDPYGNVTKVSGDRDSDFLYTGHYWHAQSGVYLTLFRAYDPELGRWLSRDPIEEEGGVNLFGYVTNDPINLVDPYGLSDESFDWLDNPVTQALVAIGDGVSDLLVPDSLLEGGISDWLHEMNPEQFGQVNKCTTAYKLGKWGGRGIVVAVALLAVAETQGIRVTIDIYKKAEGIGLNVTRGAGRGVDRLFGLDWHKFRLGDKIVNRLHYHRRIFDAAGNFMKNQSGKHRPWQGW